MNTFKMLVKIENDEIKYIYNGEYSLEMSKHPKLIRDGDVEPLLRAISETEPRKMYGIGGESLSLPSDVHRVSECSNTKREAQFTIKLFDIDMLNNTMTVLNIWEYDVKQWTKEENGHVIIKEK